MGDNSQGHELKGKIHSLPSSVLPAVYAVIKNWKPFKQSPIRNDYSNQKMAMCLTLPLGTINDSGCLAHRLRHCLRCQHPTLGCLGSSPNFTTDSSSLLACVSWEAAGDGSDNWVTAIHVEDQDEF